MPPANLHNFSTPSWHTVVKWPAKRAGPHTERRYVMYGKRFLMKALVGLLVIALLIGGASSLQRNAWMQGYMMGQLGAGGDGKAVIPYMAYGLQGYGGPGFGRRAGDTSRHRPAGPAVHRLRPDLPRPALGHTWRPTERPTGRATSSRGSAWRRRTRNVPLATGGMARPGAGTRLTRSNQRQASRRQAGQPPPRIPGNHPRITPAQSLRAGFSDSQALRFQGLHDTRPGSGAIHE